MYSLRRRNNGKSLVLVPTAKNAPRTCGGARKAVVTLRPPVRKNQAVKVPGGWVTLSKQAFDYAMWAPAWAEKLETSGVYTRWEAYWMVAKLDYADLVASIKKRFSKEAR